MSDNAASVFDVMPSGKTLLAEIREFAAKLHPDIGPMFGNDVVKLCTEAEELREKLTKQREDCRAWHDA